MTDDDIYAPQISLAKIGKRYYWVIWRFRDLKAADDDDGLIGERLTDGFCTDRETATSHALAALRAVTPKEMIEKRTAKVVKRHGIDRGTSKYSTTRRQHPDRDYDWVVAYHSGGMFARSLYQKHHVTPKVAKFSHAQADLGSLWTEHVNDDGDIIWHEYPITKITKKRIFLRDGFHRSQIVVDRAAIDRDGKWRSGGRWGWGETYYSAVVKQEMEREQARHHAEWQAQWRTQEAFRRARAYLHQEERIDPNENLLGLKSPYTKADVMAAFRREAHRHHPDKGGDSAVFRRIVAQKDRALKAIEDKAA